MFFQAIISCLYKEVSHATDYYPTLVHPADACRVVRGSLHCDYQFKEENATSDDYDKDVN